MHSYRNWNQQQHPQEVDITVNSSAHSPVIPIPVSSTPASAFISDPPSSSPKVFEIVDNQAGTCQKKGRKIVMELSLR